ncbi:MAG: carboxypeptidase-like regulatory domain-containing protein, partial [bacterium]
MQSVRRVLAVVCLLFVSTTSLRAQIVSGSVVLTDSVTAVAGVIVVASDANGVSLGRALTSARGTFSIVLPAPGDVRLTVLRIGYRPSIGPSLQVLAGATVSTRIVFEARPVVLSTINVRERETCRVQADSSLSVARVWEEARKAMLTTQIVSDNAPLVAEWIEYDRTLDTTSHLVREQRVRSTQHPTTHAFRSRPADVLASEGYVVADSSGTTYYAPDADVLLSDVFVSGHCFHLESSKAAG